MPHECYVQAIKNTRQLGIYIYIHISDTMSRGPPPRPMVWYPLGFLWSCGWVVVAVVVAVELVLLVVLVLVPVRLVPRGRG